MHTAKCAGIVTLLGYYYYHYEYY